MHYDKTVENDPILSLPAETQPRSALVSQPVGWMFTKPGVMSSIARNAICCSLRNQPCGDTVMTVICSFRASEKLFA